MIAASRRYNNLLRSMPDEDFAALAPSLTLVDLARGDDVAQPESRIRYSWFPVSGLISVVATTGSGTQAEVGIVGREGMCPVATLHGVDTEMMHVYCQIPGRALRMPAPALIAMIETRPALRAHLLGYAHNFMVQVASSALAYATQPIEARLARWLLMSLDRIDSNDVALTHESFALMLGVRRAGVTVAIQGLEAKGAVVGKRAVVTVINRALLNDIAGEAYGAPERAYERFFGIALRDGAGGGAAGGAASDGSGSAPIAGAGG